MKLPDTVLQQLKDPGLLDFMDYVSIILNAGRYELRVVNQIPTWAASEGEAVLYSSGADKRVYYYVGGTWQFAAFIGGGILLSTLSDAAAQTLVQVEKTSADLTIRLTANGVELLDITQTKVMPLPTATVDLGDASHTFKNIFVGKVGNLTGNGLVKVSGGDGTLGVDSTTYVSSLTTSTPTNLTGFIKGNGSVLSADNSTYATQAYVTIANAESNSSITPVVDGTYTVGNKLTPVTGQNGTITVKSGIITAIQSAT